MMPRDQLPRPVTILYRRLPNDIREFPGILREETSTRLVIESSIVVERPVRCSGKTIADNGYLAIWFIFKSKWYDLGKFYDMERKWVGYYCDIIKPVNNLLSDCTRTTMITDLFLDVWITPDGECFLLDEDELEHALKKQHISTALARQAREQATSLIHSVRGGRFPPSSIRKTEPLEKDRWYRSW